MEIVGVTLQGQLQDFLFAYNTLNEGERVHIMNLQREGVELTDVVRLFVSSQEEAESICKHVPQFVHIPSSSRDLIDHTVTLFSGVALSCTCEAFTYNKTQFCKHMRRAEQQSQRGWVCSCS